MSNIVKKIEKKIETNLKKFVPSALQRRFGRAARATVRAGARVHVLLPSGVEREAILLKDLGELARVKFKDGKVADVAASSIRRSPPKRRSTARRESLPPEPPMEVQQPEPMTELPEDALEPAPEEAPEEELATTPEGKTP